MNIFQATVNTLDTCTLPALKTTGLLLPYQNIWTVYVKVPLGVNECVNKCIGLDGLVSCSGIILTYCSLYPGSSLVHYDPISIMWLLRKSESCMDDKWIISIVIQKMKKEKANQYRIHNEYLFSIFSLFVFLCLFSTHRRGISQTETVT